MLKRTLKFLSSVALCSLAMGQAPATDPGTPTTLWAAESDSMTLYLLGSVHILRDTDFPLDSRFDQAFDDAELVLFEVPIDSLADAAVAARMFEMAMLPKGKTLDQVVSIETFRRAEASALELGLDPEAMRSMRPTMVAIMLGMLDLQASGVSESGVDSYFHERATEKGVPIDYFETVDEQLDLLFDVDPEFEAQFLELTLDQIDSTDVYFDEMVDAWKHGDAETLDRMLNEATERMPELFQRLVTRRNHAWMERLANWLERDRDLLIVVGAGHLVGEEGLVRLLEQQGFRIRQL